MNTLSSLSENRRYKCSIASVILLSAMSVQAAPTVTATEPSATTSVGNPVITNQTSAKPADSTQSTLPLSLAAASTAAAAPSTSAENTLAAQLRPSNKALSEANQELLSRNAQLQRQVNDLQTQTNVLVYESKGQLFLYGAFTVLISLLVGIFISWLVFVRRERW